MLVHWTQLWSADVVCASNRLPSTYYTRSSPVLVTACFIIIRLPSLDRTFSNLMSP